MLLLLIPGENKTAVEALSIVNASYFHQGHYSDT